MRNLILQLVALLSWFYRIIPRALRRRLVFGLLMLESRIGSPDQALRALYPIRDDLDRLLSERAAAYEGGIHPKHRLMQYHDFFVNIISPNSRVIDIGCGYGAVARSIANRVQGSQVTGVEIDDARFEQAITAKNPSNLEFVHGDAFTVLPDTKADVVVLSNVLEHIENRQSFLERIKKVLHPDKLLIRVPCFEREWHVPMRKELGISYFNDQTHFIEHTVAELQAELHQAGICIDSLQTVWGEIWVNCHYREQPAS